MTPDQIYKEVEQFVEANWNQGKYTFGDLAFKQGEEAQLAESWVKFGVRVGEARQLEIGLAGLGMRNGKILADVYSPKGALRAGGQLAGLVEAMFRRKNLGGVRCGEPQSVYIENNRDRWLHHQVTVPFTTATGE